MFYDSSAVLNAFRGICGWRGSMTDLVYSVPNDYSNSASGLYFNDAHPRLTFDNVLSVAPDFKGENPAVNDNIYAVNFSTWLSQQTDAAILQVISNWLEEKSIMATARTLLDQGKLYQGNGNEADAISDNVGFAGVEVYVNGEESKVLKIDSIGLHLTGAETVNLYLYELGTGERVVQECTVNRNDQWTAVDWKLKGGHTYYILYQFSDLTSQAINGAKEHNYGDRGSMEIPCSKFFKARTVTGSGTLGTSIGDINDLGYLIGNNYGLNFSFSVQCDYTDFLIRQKSKFARVLQLGVGMHFARMFVHNPYNRINRNEALNQDRQLLFEIDGDSQGRDDFSLFGKYKKAIKAIQFDRTAVDKDCLPCKKRGITFKSIGSKW